MCASPSGDATKQIIRKSFAPACRKIVTASAAEPPVASIGSTKSTGPLSISRGNRFKYTVGFNVRSSRANPRCPILASGIISKIPSAIPNPDRSTGTTVMFADNLRHITASSGVCTSTSPVGKDRVTS